MTTGRTVSTSIFIALASTVAGCAQPGPLQSYRTNVGALKASLSHLEYQNEQLQKKVADLDSRNREIGDKLVQEESTNGELVARLNDARHELRRRGLDLGDTQTVSDDDAESPKPQRTLPAGRSNRSKRKPPFARIPGRIDTLPEEGQEDGEDRQTAPPEGEREEFGSQSRLNRDNRWLPVARGSGDGERGIR